MWIVYQEALFSQEKKKENRKPKQQQKKRKPSAAVVDGCFRGDTFRVCKLLNHI